METSPNVLEIGREAWICRFAGSLPKYAPARFQIDVTSTSLFIFALGIFGLLVRAVLAFLCERIKI